MAIIEVIEEWFSKISEFILKRWDYIHIYMDTYRKLR